MYPIVVVKSFGQENSRNIIEEILREDGQAGRPFIIEGFLGYECQLNTKYYNIKVILVNIDKDLPLVPSGILNHVEAVFFYFDSHDKTFLESIDTLCKFVQNHNIQLATLLTRKLSEDESQGPTYTTLKDICKQTFEIIDLEERPDSVNDQCEEYYEVWDILKNHIWSTVKVPSQKCLDVCDTSAISSNSDSMEEKLNLFEELLTKVQNIRESSKTLTREQLLSNAEQLAELLINVMVDD